MSRLPDDLVLRLHQRARAWQWDVPVERFAEALTRSALSAHRLESLHLEDLALACACALGHERAWEHFIREYRPVMHRAATAMAGSAGPDLADSLHADLFGLKVKDEARQPLFTYFHGRSSLATWLRAVMAQRHVDAVRSARRLEPLPDDEERMPAAPESPHEAMAAGLTVRIQRALADAIARLAPRDRLRLGWYYAQGMTLAQIGRALKEHEATVSRHLTRTRKALRADVEQHLATAGLAPTAIAEAFDAIVHDARDTDLHQLLGNDAVRKNAPLIRSTDEETL